MAVWLRGRGVMDDTAVGLVVGSAVVTNRIGSLPFVRLVDRFHKRTVIIGSQLAVLVVAVLFHEQGAARSGAMLGWLATATAFGLANSIGTLAQISFIAEQFESHAVKRAFSAENVTLNAAIGVTPLLASVLLVRAESLFALAPGVFALAGIALAARMPPDGPGSSGANSNGTGVRVSRSGAGLFLSLNFLMLVAYAQFYDIFPAYAVHRLGAERIGVLFTFSSVAIVVCQLLLTRLTARIGDTAQLAFAGLVTAGGTLLLINAGFPVTLVAVCGLTLAEMVYGPLLQARAVEAFAGRTTLAMGAITFVWGLGESLATLTGLSLIGRGLGYVSFLIGAAACALVAAAMLTLAFRTAGRNLLHHSGFR
jgi:MFS family permease